MTRRHARLICTLGAALAAAPGAASSAVQDAQLWTWQAVGDDAPRSERFEVHSDSVRWLDPQGRTQWHYRRATGVLTLIDHEAGRYRRLDAAGVRGLGLELSAAMAAQRQRIDALPPTERDAAARALDALPSPGRPWAWVESADATVSLNGTDEVAGLSCRRIGLLAGQRPVGEACIADAGALAGGDAVLQMLVALQRLTNELRPALATAPVAAWPLHPLVVAARSGGLPLRVVEAVTGEQRRELRLAPVQRLPSVDDRPAIPRGYTPHLR